MNSWVFRRTCIFTILMLQIFSSQLNLPFGSFAGLNIFRLFLLAISIFLILRIGFSDLPPQMQAAIWAGSILALVMTMSLAWSQDIESGLRQLSYTVTLVAIIYSMGFFIKSNDEFVFTCKLLIVTGLAISSIAFYEIRSGDHWFASAIQDTAYSDISLDYIDDNLAWFTFGNPNDLAVHLTLCALLGMTIFRQSVLPFLMFGACAYLSLYLDARLVTITLMVYTLMFVFSILFLRATGFYSSLVIYAGSVLTAMTIGLFGTENLEYIDVSIFIRTELVASAIEMAKNSYFVGVGTGSFEYEMVYSGFVDVTYGIVNPHSGFARMFAEVGIVGFLIFSFIVVGPIVYAWKARLVTENGRVLILAAMAMPLLFSIGSDPMSSSTLQLGVALLWIGASIELRQVTGAGSHNV